MLAQHEVCKRIKPVDLAPVLRVLDALEFADSGGKCAWVTKPGSIAPEPLMDLVRDLGLGGKPARLFCRKLMPHQGIAPHVDDYEAAWKVGALRRFHVPLTSHPDIKMRWPDDGVEQHLEPGYLWEVRFDRTHEVVNDTECSRVHIQIDQLNATI